MAIKVSGTTVIDNSKNLTNVASIGFADGSSLTNSTLSTASYVTTDNVGGQLLHTLDNPNAYSTSASDTFGQSVAISGNYAIVSAYGEDDSGGTTSGKAYIFDVTTGALVHTLDNPNAYDTSADDGFGRGALAIDGNYAIVAAYLEDDSGGLSSGKAYIFDVTTGTLVHTLDNPNAYDTSASDNFGYSVAISGNYCIVSAYQEDDSGGTSSGKAYIFNVTTGELVHTLDNPNPYSTSVDDNFGSAVDISGNYAIVGAYGEQDSNAGPDEGKAYIFNVTTGELVHTLNNPNSDGVPGGYFGRFSNSVGISGNYCIVGSYYDYDSINGNVQSGKAYIFNVTTGALIHTLDNPNAYDTSLGDFFGQAVGISGNYCVAGAWREDDSGGTQSGKVYIFNVTTGVLVHTLDNPNAYSTSASDAFGSSVEISGNYVIVGTPTEDDSGGSASGKAYIFNVDNSLSISQINSIRFTHGNALEASHPIFDQAYVGGQLIHTLDNPNPYDTSTTDYFSYSLAISGNYCIVGARFEDEAGNTNSGKAYIFNVTTGALVHTLDNPNVYSTSNGDQFGSAVAISGNYAFVCAPNENDTPSGKTDVGVVYIFNVTTGLLVDTIFIPFTPTLTKYYFGERMSVSGNYCIIGLSNNSVDEAYIFKTTTGDWTDTALLHTLTIASPINFGESVAIDGNYAIVGDASQTDSGGNNSGKAYIFNVTTGELLHTLDNPNAYSTSANDNFSEHVAISGDYAIVSAGGEDDSGGLSSGKAYIFNVTTGELLHTLDNPTAYSTSDGDRFGYDVDISGNYAIVGAYLEDDSGGGASGKAYIFNVTTGALVHTLDNPNPYSTSAVDYFGWSVTISGNYVIVGAYGEDDSDGTTSGKAYIFAVDNMTYLDKAAQLVLE